MKDRVVNYFFRKIKKNNNFDKVKLEEIKYGLYGLYTLLTKTSAIIIISLLLNMFDYFIIFLIFYCLLRSVGYGTHLHRMARLPAQSGDFQESGQCIAPSGGL